MCRHSRTCLHCRCSTRCVWKFSTTRRNIWMVSNGGAHHDFGYEFGHICSRACRHQPDRHRRRPDRDVRHARLQPDAGADRDLPAVHDPDQRHRFCDSAAAVEEVAAVAPVRLSLAGAAGDRLLRAVRQEALRCVALDLCADRADLALSQRVRAGDPELPEDTGAACAGAERAAGRAAVRRRPGHRAGVLRRRDHRRDQALPAGADIR